MINLSERQDIIGYLSWCEANDIKPFDEDDDIDNENQNEENNINIDKNKVLKKGRMINNE
jgi:hypothetical protein